MTCGNYKGVKRVEVERGSFVMTRMIKMIYDDDNDGNIACNNDDENNN